MKIEDAKQVLRDFRDISNPNEYDEIGYVEALEFMIDKTKDPAYMTELGWFYCTKKRFDMEVKYMEMAAECGDIRAAEELGYMFYYGQHGDQDYEKAFRYFSMGAEKGKRIDTLWCRYKLADMYRFGCFVEKDEKKYREMIEEAYEDIRNPRYTGEAYPEIAYRKAGLLIEDGKVNEAVVLLKKAKRFMAERLSDYIFWGHIEMMGRIINRLYELIPFDEEAFDFYDLFYLTKKPAQISFKYAGRPFELEVSDDDEPAIGFEGKWFRDFAEFCEKADLGKDKIIKNYDALYDWEVA